MAPVVAALRQKPGLDSRLLLTGQHDDLVDQVLDSLDLRPDYDLEIMREGQSLYDVAQGMCWNPWNGITMKISLRKYIDISIEHVYARKYFLKKTIMKSV